MRTRILIVTTLLAVASVARAEPDKRTVTLTDASRAATADEAIAASVRGDDSCQPACTYAVDQSRTLANGLRLDVRHATNTGFSSTGYIVTFTSPSGDAFLWSTDDTGKLRNPAIDVTPESSGMGKSLNQKLVRISIELADKVVWIKFEISSSLTHWGDHHHPSVATSRLQKAIGCRIDGTTPRCGSVLPASNFASDVMVFSKQTVSIAYNDGSNRELVTLSSSDGT